MHSFIAPIFIPFENSLFWTLSGVRHGRHENPQSRRLDIQLPRTESWHDGFFQPCLSARWLSTRWHWMGVRTLHSLESLNGLVWGGTRNMEFTLLPVSLEGVNRLTLNYILKTLPLFQIRKLYPLFCINIWNHGTLKCWKELKVSSGIILSKVFQILDVFFHHLYDFNISKYHLYL